MNEEERLMRLMKLRARLMHSMRWYHKLRLKRLVDEKKACPPWMKPIEVVYKFCQRQIGRKAEKIRTAAANAR